MNEFLIATAKYAAYGFAITVAFLMVAFIVGSTLRVLYELMRWAWDADFVLGEWRAGLLFQKGGVWVGVHYSNYNRRWCINLLPCCTLWVMLPGGRTPHQCMRKD